MLRCWRLAAIPPSLSDWTLALNKGGLELIYTFDTHADHNGVPELLAKLDDLGVQFTDLSTEQSSLEDIFVHLVHNGAEQ